MKANVKAKDKSGLTPFHYAAIKDNRKAAEYIINNCTSEIFYVSHYEIHSLFSLTSNCA